MNKRKTTYQLFTDGRGHFAVGRKGAQLMEYADVPGMLYGKMVDEKLVSTGITEEYVQDWIEELKEAEILDDDGNIIYQEL